MGTHSSSGSICETCNNIDIGQLCEKEEESVVKRY